MIENDAGNGSEATPSITVTSSDIGSSSESGAHNTGPILHAGRVKTFVDYGPCLATSGTETWTHSFTLYSRSRTVKTFVDYGLHLTDPGTRTWEPFSAFQRTGTVRLWSEGGAWKTISGSRFWGRPFTLYSRSVAIRTFVDDFVTRQVVDAKRSDFGTSVESGSASSTRSASDASPSTQESASVGIISTDVGTASESTVESLIAEDTGYGSDTGDFGDAGDVRPPEFDTAVGFESDPDVAQSPTDQFSSYEFTSGEAQVSDSDSGTASIENGSPSVFDVGSDDEYVIDVTVTTSTTDTGTSTQATTIDATTLSSDTGFGNDGVGNLQDARLTLDQGSSTESVSIVATIAASDSGTSSETASAPTAVYVSHAGQVKSFVPLVSNALPGSRAWTPLPNTSHSGTARVWAEASWIHFLGSRTWTPFPSTSRSGTAEKFVEIVFLTAHIIKVADTGHGTETRAVAGPSSIDTGSGTETFVLIQEIKTSQDSGSSIETASVTVSTSTTDSGIGSESHNSIQDFTVQDYGIGSEATAPILKHIPLPIQPITVGFDMQARFRVLQPGGPPDYPRPFWKWQFFDPITGDTTNFSINPKESESPNYDHQVTYQPVTAPGAKWDALVPRVVVYEGTDAIQQMIFSGSILDPDEYRILLGWFRLRRAVYLSDDLGRTFHVYLKGLRPKRTYAASDFWKHDYECTVDLLAEV